MALSSSFYKLADDLRRGLDGWIERNPEGAARVALWLEDQMGASAEERAPIDFLGSFMEAVVPRNWKSLRVGLHVQARRVMGETGICLVWVPPAEVVEALVLADGKVARDQVLVTNSGHVLDSIDAVLAEAVHPRLEVSVAAAS